HFISGMFGTTTPAPAPSAPEARAINESAAEARQIDGFLGGLTIAPVPASGIVDVTYTGSSPVVVARYANAIAKSYVDQNLELKSTAVKDVAEWLSPR